MIVSARTFGIGVVLALGAGFLIGFIPQHNSSVAAAHANDQAQTQLAQVQQEASINGFKNQMAVVYVEAEKKNFAQASTDASKLFTAMQSYSDHSSDSSVRQELSPVLTMRDTIIGGLAKGDDTVTGQLQDLFLKLQGVGL